MSDQAGPRLRLPQVLGYAERPEVEEDGFDRWGRRMFGLLVVRGAGVRARRLRAIVTRTNALEATFAGLCDAELRLQAEGLRVDMRRAVALDRVTAANVAPAFALVREVAARTLGKRHYDVQLMGAFAMLRGEVAQMRTGEGKTLCATLAAVTMALAGQPVHVITVNDYLAKRDAEAMAPLYRFFGLEVGIVQTGQQEGERRDIYAADIVHASNKELTFDYLRDRMVLRDSPGNLARKVDRLTPQARGLLRMRGLHFAIIDEADSVLIDEARTPLVISGAIEAGRGNDMALYRTARAAALKLVEGKDYRIKANENRVELLDAGRDRLEDMAEGEQDTFRVPVIREHSVTQALTAQHLFNRDEAYIIRDGKVQIVDENTGRVMEDRSWSEGLHQMVELKEDVEPTDPRETLSRITYQRFFRRYRRLGGMTGTAQDAASELWSVYGLAVTLIPTHKPERRTFARDRVYRSEDRKWQAVAERVEMLSKKGCPVLLGTRSVAGSEKASLRLTELGVAHQVLSAAQDADEAAIIEMAGQRGMVTVATNMAGRGTDIGLGEGVADFGGLHVMLTERHDSRRVDRQLEGRCGRQGDPGRVEAFLSLEDELMRSKGARFHRGFARLALLLGPRAAGVFIRMRQRSVERVHAGMRHDLLETDRKLGDLLAFSGQLE
ncbi:MAG: preprotein translocase subunit SecA [Paracoccaceae bacterium]|jgi:preprotein translocase subunit SecA